MQVILVTIVSEQTVPSVLFIKEFQKSVDSYLFVSTEKMDKKREAICIAAGVRIDQCLPTILVNENSLIDIEQKLSALEFPPESRFVVNLTGGTKLMSFGVYDFFKKFEHEAYYLPIGRNEMLRVFSGAAVKPTPIAYRLSVKEYLDSYSLSFVKDERRQPKFSREQANVLFNSNISNFDRHKVCTDSIWKFRNKKMVLNDFRRVSNWLNEIGFTQKRQGSLDEGETKYLSGDWFEEWLYFQLRDKLRLEEKCIWQGVHVGVHEYDLLIMLNNRIMIIECKTSIEEIGGAKEFRKEVVQKLAALKPKFGKDASAHLFTLSEGIGSDRKSMLDEENIFLVDRSILSDIVAFENFISSL